MQPNILGSEPYEACGIKSVSKVLDELLTLIFNISTPC